MPTNAEDIISLFGNFQRNIDEEQNLREAIHDAAKELEKEVRQMSTILQGVHLESSFNNLGDLLEKSSCLIGNCAEVYQKLSGVVPSREYYRYHDHWRSVTQRAVFCLTLIEYLSNGRLATREQLAIQLSLKKDQNEGFHLDLEDYLHGLLQLVSELSRLAVNSAASSDYKRPVAISQFVNELNAGFRLINFKNDNLRKHYDGLKYDLKKIEEVVYDLSIRGLKPATSHAISNTGDASEGKKSPDSSLVEPV